MTVNDSLLPNDTFDFGGNNVEAHELGQGNIAGDPLFVDAASGDFRLQPNSPAVAATTSGLDMGVMVSATATITQRTQSGPDGEILLDVAGPGVTEYRYRLNGGALGPRIPVDQPIAIDAQAEGAEVQLHAINSAGEWISERTAGFGQTIQLIAPRTVVAGESLPVVARALDWQRQVNSTYRGIHSLDHVDGTLSDGTLHFMKGVATLSSTVNATTDFQLDVAAPVAGQPSAPVSIRVPGQAMVVHEVMGTLEGNQTWVTGREYRLTSDVVVSRGASVTIEPGARVVLDPRVNLRVEGTLRSLGTAEDPVLFTATTDAWGGLEFIDAGADNELRYTFFTQGGADGARVLGHSDSQPVILSQGSTVTCEHCFVIDNVGKAFGARNGVINIWNSVVANVDTGGEFVASVADIQRTWVLNVPDGQPQFVDDDNDGFYFSGTHDSGQPSRFVDSVMMNTKDDGIDHNGARLEVSGAWIEGAFHEGIAASNANWVTVVDSVLTGNNQGLEAGYGAPNVTISKSVVVGNRNVIDPDQPIAAGIRFGDGYDGAQGAYNGLITATELVLYDNADNVRNFDGTIPGPKPGAVDVTFSLVNDDDPELVNTTNLSQAIPVFDARMRLLRGSPGFEHVGGMPIGRRIPTTIWRQDDRVAEGDFNRDGVLDVSDIDLFCAQVGQPADEPQFDLNQDGVVDSIDLERLIYDLMNTRYGDSNLDGVFDSSDLVQVFIVGEYEDDVEGNSTWADGDWNCDGEFDTRDLVFAFQA